MAGSGRSGWKMAFQLQVHVLWIRIRGTVCEGSGYQHCRTEAVGYVCLGLSKCVLYPVCLVVIEVLTLRIWISGTVREISVFVKFYEYPLPGCPSTQATDRGVGCLLHFDALYCHCGATPRYGPLWITGVIAAEAAFCVSEPTESSSEPYTYHCRQGRSFSHLGSDGLDLVITIADLCYNVAADINLSEVTHWGSGHAQIGFPH